MEAEAIPPGQGLTATQHLPALRKDLQLLRGPRSWRGEPLWQLYDPLRHRFFQISERDIALLNAWQPGPAGETLLRAQNEVSDFTLQEIESLLEFLVNEELLRTESAALRERLERFSRRREQTILQTMLHKYLFFRLPLVRPDKFLDWLYRYARILIQPWFIWASILIGIIGMASIVRQWPQFMNAFSFFFTLPGMAVFTLTLVFVKILHELGHALMCKHYGLKVPTMGVAFLVMWPVLYTDATDAWRLPYKRQRAAISAAGVSVELILACYAMFLWVVLPDGLARSAAFVVATTAWITSVLVNLNPLMRFDGYYFLSDLLNVPNLQDRSLALARWRWRGWLFGVNEKCPDDLPPRLVKWLVIYAWALLIYRFLLFLGIALLVYHFFFKALGIFLFLVEIWWFIARPIVREIREWPGYIDKSTRHRQIGGLFLLVFFVLVLVVPWRTHIEVPAVLSSARHQHMYSGLSAAVAHIGVTDGQHVTAGEILIQLASPDLDQQIVQMGHEIEHLELLLSQGDTGGQRMTERQVIIQRLLHARAELNGLQREQARLAVKAPHAGIVKDLDRSLYSGRWIGPEDRLLTLVDHDELLLTGWLPESDLGAVTEGSFGYFHADGHPDWQRIPVIIDQISRAATTHLDPPHQASVYGGRVPVHVSGDQLRPVHAHFIISGLVRGTTESSLDRRLRGTVIIRGERRSLIVRGVTHIVAVVLRESGF
jgi:putative peptide zinc metalloprotease protein